MAEANLREGRSLTAAVYFSGKCVRFKEDFNSKELDVYTNIFYMHKLLIGINQLNRRNHELQT